MKNIINIIVVKIKIIFEELKSNEGFTLIEIIIAISIIAILSIVAIPRLMEIPQKARISAAKQQIHLLDLALTQYEADNGNFPSTSQGLEALVKKPDGEPVPANYNEKGYMQKVPMDPWGRPYVYTSPGTHGNDYDIMSYGADGQEGGEGKNADIKSWE